MENLENLKTKVEKLKKVLMDFFGSSSNILKLLVN